MTAMSLTIHRLSAIEVDLMLSLLGVFGDAFCDAKTYQGCPPSRAYLERLLDKPQFIALVARNADQVVGGLVAYELEKFEQERSEIYIYDLAVSEGYRRLGIATALIERLRTIAAEQHAHVILVQADHGDHPAIALYTKLGVREDVLHFDIPVDRSKSY